MEEASEFLKKMNDVPGMKNMSSMFKSMGMPMGKGKMNVNAMQSHMQENIKMSKMKERMRKKLDANKKSSKDEQIKLLEKQLAEAKTENVKITGSIKSKRKKRRNRKKNKNKK
jgi:CRISPR/Cas system-associated endonuclease Cas3-HD